MKADVGFPDKHKKYLISLLILQVASVVDFPGFIFTLPERTNTVIQKANFLFHIRVINKKNKTYENIC